MGQVGRDDLEVVIGRGREGAATIAFTERPDPVDVGAQHVVDTDIPPAVDLHPSGAQAEIVGIGSPANGDQNVGSANHAVALKAVHSDGDAFVIGFKRNAMAVSSNDHSFRHEHFGQGGGDRKSTLLNSSH